MSNAKRDMMKEIEAKVARKKLVASQASRQKTVANWVSDFFTEYEKTKKLDTISSYNSFAMLALNRLIIQLQTIDRRCQASFKKSEDGSGVVIEIHWSKIFSQTNNCEQTLVFDASSAYFQSALECI